MKIDAVKTRLVRAGEISLNELLAESISELSENSVVAISSKVVALCENRVVPLDEIDKDELIARESDWFIPRDFSPYGITFAIAQGNLAPSAGIDESNADGKFVLWPKNAMKAAEEARIFLSKKFSRKNLGVIITDSTCTPLRRGTVGVMIGWSGFRALNDWRDKPDLFGRKFKVEVSNVANSLAAAANIVMGEGDESTPLAIISDINFLKFILHAPTRNEVRETFVAKDEDLFAPFLNLAPWQKGDSGREK